MERPEYGTLLRSSDSPVDPITSKVYLVGSGIASLSAAAFMIRDGHIPGGNITIFEELDIAGGSLDGSGSPEAGYVLRGGRMFERQYRCTFDLFSSIHTLDDNWTVTEQTLDWNERMKTSSTSRLVSDGRPETNPPFGLGERHILTIERLAIEPEIMLGRSSIADQFDPAFFETNFWFMWSTTFAFQPWHSAVEFKRYLARFAHLIGGFGRLEGIMRTVLNQYDSLVRPLQKWLNDRGVRIELRTRVTGLGSDESENPKRVTSILYERDGKAGAIDVLPDDYVLVTLGSMTEGSSLGTMETAATPKGKRDGGAWTLWEKLAAGRPEFGRPAVFCDHVDQSKWISFTTTLHHHTFPSLVRKLTGNAPGEGGLITFPRSNWMVSIVIPFQPHFIGQPEDVTVFWGYGLSIDRPGNFVAKPMAACSGREIMIEVLGHLHIGKQAAAILESCICIPCLMPFITSQFLPRDRGDRPEILPEGWSHLAFTGQFCELPDDVVFTVEYSIRSAQTAVYALLGLSRKPPAVYKSTFHPRALYKAFMALHEFSA